MSKFKLFIFLQNFLRDDIHTLGKTTGALVRATLYLIRQSLVTPDAEINDASYAVPTSEPVTY